MPKRILILDQSAAESYLQRWSDRLKDRGHRVDISQAHTDKDYDLVLARASAQTISDLSPGTQRIIFYGSEQTSRHNVAPKPNMRRYVPIYELDQLLITFAENLWDEDPNS